MSRKIISCIFLLFIIIVSLLFSHFIFKHSIEAFGHDKSDKMTNEDTILNPYFIAFRNNSIKTDFLPVLGDFFKKLV